MFQNVTAEKHTFCCIKKQLLNQKFVCVWFTFKAVYWVQTQSTVIWNKSSVALNADIQVQECVQCNKVNMPSGSVHSTGTPKSQAFVSLSRVRCPECGVQQPGQSLILNDSNCWSVGSSVSQLSTDWVQRVEGRGRGGGLEAAWGILPACTPVCHALAWVTNSRLTPTDTHSIPEASWRGEKTEKQDNFAIYRMINTTEPKLNSFCNTNILYLTFMAMIIVGSTKINWLCWV